ncbi:probable LRR receptor-like serine/threonine-protein kinase At3g47570 [Eucalyptus grandis]|uniref:probable LRR receptor-like serine/threonine-protein kinase At3g47570 n=1 Tax=Eucalyptus grandis TaxID=71139 RepID=UPI00192E8679|nr:probable LRR receptor-like serine/threonine-protein kinase At3g47570 [Eucalyptus grandis]
MKEKQFRSVLYILVLIYIRLCPSMARARDADTDREALAAFKSAISDPRNALASWNLGTSHCNWTGVSCTKDGEMRVNSLILADLGLTGILPSQLSNLSSLQYLDLHQNSFSGEIPSSFGRLTALRRIILYNNSISGLIPASLSQCRSLEEISFAFNNISGKLPAELGSLTELKILDVSVNNLTGSIPKTSGNLSALTSLSLARNRLSGELPNELGNLQNLAVLQLSENVLTGTIPPWIFNISTLEFISLTQNKLAGTLPSSVNVSLANLEQLYLAENMIEGLLPNYLFNSSQIQELDFSSNQFHGSIPSLGNMKSLKSLHLGYNNLSSTTDLNLQTFRSLVNCTKLEILYLNSNQLASELPSSIGNLSVHLQEFCIDGNHLTKEFPDVLDRFQNLTALSIHENRFTGKFPSTVGRVHWLRRLQAHGNNFYGEIPDSFGNLTQLYHLTMGFNEFSGRFPSSIGNSKQLKVLGLASNSLSGNIPEEIFRLPNLRDVRLAKNQLNGSLSSLVGRLKQLELLDVSDNQLSGSIPTAIGGCSSLDALKMARNNLSGQIPSQIGDLSALRSLDLSWNNLSGSIPVELGDLQILQSLNLSFNHLEGQVPGNGAFVNLTWDKLQGNNELCMIDAKAARKLGISTCEAMTKKKSNQHHLLAVLIPVSISIVLACCILCFTWIIIQKKRKIKERESSFPPPLIRGLPKKVSYDELHRATDGFAQENLIGKGGFGSVYKAVFMWRNDGSCICRAVKVIDLEQSKASRSFNMECKALKFIRHRNLVKVITSCSSIDNTGHEFKALVMEYMPKGNLEKWLYPEDVERDGSSLSLMQRLNVAIDVASAMDYLHHDCNPPVVHCDLKPGNVLLDDNMVAHVGDFGLARFLHQIQQETGHSTIGLQGSIGYIPPEYGMGSRASPSGDVYSFGILLLEMLVLKKPTDQMFEEGLNLRIFVSALDNGGHKVLDIADPRLFANNETSNSTGSDVSSSSFLASPDNLSLGGSTNPRNSWLMRCEECVAALIRLGLSCAAPSAKDRPSMREALARLREIKRGFPAQLKPPDHA